MIFITASKIPTKSNKSKRGRKKMDERRSLLQYLISPTFQRPNLYIDERKAKRLIQNRKSAVKCRQKKKDMYERLLVEKNSLEAQNYQLQSQFNQLSNEFEESLGAKRVLEMQI